MNPCGSCFQPTPSSRQRVILSNRQDRRVDIDAEQFLDDSPNVVGQVVFQLGAVGFRIEPIQRILDHLESVPFQETSQDQRGEMGHMDLR